MEMSPWLLLAVLALIALAAPRYGVDSRLPSPGEDPPPPRRGPTPWGDLRALLAVRSAAAPGRRARTRPPAGG
ncbi:MAG TPA: hypothetical protein VGE11_11140 [Pseudonocardia sp.]